MLNKYIPPDFDPAKIPRGRAPKGGQIKVRIMLPMTICCNTCGEFICKGTKFNARKEDVKGEDYLGIQIFRFYFRCTRCSAELAMKTTTESVRCPDSIKVTANIGHVIPPMRANPFPRPTPVERIDVG